MKKNIGIVDKIIRLAVAAIIAVLYFTGTVTGIWGIVLLVFAGLNVVFSLIGFCPMYPLFGMNTAKAKKAK